MTGEQVVPLGRFFVLALLALLATFLVAAGAWLFSEWLNGRRSRGD